MTTVSRSTYQKVVEENKRLKEDIKVLVIGPVSPEFKTVSQKWSVRFYEEDELNNALKEAAKQYLSKHPELNIKK